MYGCKLLVTISIFFDTIKKSHLSIIETFPIIDNFFLHYLISIHK